MRIRTGQPPLVKPSLNASQEGSRKVRKDSNPSLCFQSVLCHSSFHSSHSLPVDLHSSSRFLTLKAHSFWSCSMIWKWNYEINKRRADLTCFLKLKLQRGLTLLYFTQSSYDWVGLKWGSSEADEAAASESAEADEEAKETKASESAVSESYPNPQTQRNQKLSALDPGLFQFKSIKLQQGRWGNLIRTIRNMILTGVDRAESGNAGSRHDRRCRKQSRT